MSDRIDTDRVQAALVAPVGGPVVWASAVGSTNDLIAMRAREGAPEGLVIGADVQTQGRGRRGRAWEATAGDALLFSVLLRPSRVAGDVGLLPIAAAVGVAEGLAELGVAVGLVWPNDLIVDGKKLGGILCELSSAGQALSWAVVGVGINVRASPSLVAARWEPTNLADVLGTPPAREVVLTAVLRGLGTWCARWYETGDAPVLRAFAGRDLLAGRNVQVTVGESTLRGVAIGLDAAGALQVRTASGAVVAVSSGEVTGVDAIPPAPSG